MSYIKNPVPRLLRWIREAIQLCQLFSPFTLEPSFILASDKPTFVAKVIVLHHLQGNWITTVSPSMEIHLNDPFQPFRVVRYIVVCVYTRRLGRQLGGSFAFRSSPCL